MNNRSDHPACPTRPLGGNERGIALVTVVLGLLLAFLLTAAVIGTAVVESQISRNYTDQTQALYIAEAGVERARLWLHRNMNDDLLVNAVLASAVGTTVNTPPDQATVTVGATTVDTPLGTLGFGDGSYTVWIRDNADDSDPATDSDGSWIVTSRGRAQRDSAKLIEVELARRDIVPSGVLTFRSDEADPALLDGSHGTGVQIPHTAVDGNSYDIAGSQATGCSPIPAIATDHIDSTTPLVDELSELRERIAKRANDFCESDGTTQGGDPPCSIGDDGCCTPGLWWVRGSASTPRYDDSDPASYNLLDLSSPELHAIGADYVTTTQPPTVFLGTPPDAPFDGGAGNVVADPTVTQTTQAALTEEIALILDTIAQTPAGDRIVVADGLIDGTSQTYGSLTSPKVVEITDGQGLRLQNGAVFEGFGILVVPHEIDLEASTFAWTGIVLLNGDPEARFESEDSTGQLNGAVYLNAPGDRARFRTDDFDQLKITYSCDAIALAMSPLRLRTLNWLELYQ